MKIYIGPYKKWIGPYQIAEALCFWVKRVPDEFGIKRKPDWVHDFGTWLGETKTGDDSWLTKLCQWVDSKREHTVKIRIDKYDTWGMDSTLAMIVVPMLKQLKETKHGAPLVDDKDVPVELRSTSAPPKKEKHDIDDNHFKRWDWVLDEMIWAFEQKNIDWESQYFSGEHDIKMVPCEFDEDGKPKMYKMEKGPKDTSKFDRKAFLKHRKRMANGFRLFGKYYNGLWD
jgi:hypothetical protein